MSLLACKDGKIAYSNLLHRLIVYFEIYMLNKINDTNCIDCTWDNHKAHNREPESVSYFGHWCTKI